jgi:uncharacterized membrane protein HdeD (DUF308 family)
MNTWSAQQSLRPPLAPAEQSSPRSAGLLIGVGAVKIAVGLIAIVWPAVAAVSLAILLGCLLLIEGGVALVGAYAARGWQLLGRLVWSVVSGLAGVYLIVYPDEGVIGLTAALVIVMFVAGAAMLAAGLLGDENRGLLIAVGAVDIVAGALIWANLPSSAGWAIGLLVGCHFLASGIETTSFGLDLRRRTKQGPRIGGQATVGHA